MNNKAIATFLMIAIAGCAAPTSQSTKDLEQAPTFTEEEKAAMTTEEKVAVYNESMSEDKDELVCRREKRVGSHFPRTVCFTRAEIELQRKSAQDTLQRSKGTLNGAAN